MNHTKNYTVCILMLITGFVLASSAIAQKKSEQIPEPSEPLVAKPSAATQWLITLEKINSNTNDEGIDAVQPAPPPPPKAPKPLSSVKYETTAEVTKITRRYEGGLKLTAFLFEEGGVLEKSRNGKVYNRGSGDGTVDSSVSWLVSDYPGTQWITMRNYVGVDEIENVKCYKFVEEKIDMSNESEVRKHTVNGLFPAHLKSDKIAWISIENQLPVRIAIGDTYLNYSSISNFEGNITLPAEFSEKLEELKSEQAVLRALRN